MNSGIVNISIISLKSDFIKRDSLLSELEIIENHSRVRISVIDAINGKDMSAIDYFINSCCASSKFFGRKKLSPSELGCFLSHKYAIESFLKTEHDWLLVLEDDVSITGDILNFLSSIDSFDENGLYILGGQNGLNSFDRVILKKRDIKSPSKIRFGTHRWIYRTCCYMLNRVKAVELYSLMNKNKYMADDWIYISKNTTIKDFFYIDLFSHPVELNNSNIESERKFLQRKSY